MLDSTRLGILVTGLLVGWSSVGEARAIASHFKLKGTTATATFIETDSGDACVETTTDLIATSTMEKVSPGPRRTSAGLVVILIRRDLCTGEVLFDGFGDQPVQSFGVSGNARSVTVVATVPVFDPFLGTSETVRVNVTWTATGAAVRQHDRVHTREEGILVNGHYRGLHAPAVARGSVFGFGQNLTSDPSVTAEIQTQNIGEITINKAN